MPELPEVENFRRLLSPLISGEHPLILERCSTEKIPPRKFITDEEICEIHSHKLVVADVLRKGKLICMVLNGTGKKKGGTKKENRPTKYLFLHMGMTGRISTPQCIPKLKELSDTEIYPPPNTYLRLVAGPNQACFSDPRKFGAIYLKDALEEDFDSLAPDAWTSTRTLQVDNSQEPEEESTIHDILLKLSEQSMGIKGVLLDQKRAVCGVGNWVADEVLYQTRTHPDQNYLTKGEAKVLLHRLHIILDQAVQCLYKDQDFPLEWLFHYRWSKRGSSKTAVKDAHGRSIVFVTSGGRTSAVVPSIQNKESRKPATTSKPKKAQKKSKESVGRKKRALSTLVSKSSAKPVETKSANSVKKLKATKKEKESCSQRALLVGSKRGIRRSPRLANC